MRALLLLSLLGACDGSPPPVPVKPSSALPVSSIDVTATLTSNGAAVLVDVSVTGANMAVRLDSDALVASAVDASALALGEYTPGHYAVLLPTASQTVTLSFLRAGKAVASADITLPTPFVIQAPASASRSMALPLTWAPGAAGETLALAIKAPCVAGGAVARNPDPLGGGFTIQAADFLSQPGACTLSIELARTQSMPKAIGGLGSFSQATVVQKRTLELVTQP